MNARKRNGQLPIQRKFHARKAHDFRPGIFADAFARSENEHFVALALQFCDGESEACHDPIDFRKKCFNPLLLDFILQ
jgi:hypothetical protein